MHDALSVRVGESAGDIAQYAQALLERNRALQDAHAQRLPAHERHRKVWEPAHRLTGTEYRYDVRLLERGRELDLPGESCRREFVGELRWQHLHDDFPAERFVASHEHAGHSTRAQLPLYRIVAPERLLELIEEVVQGFLSAGI